MKHISNILLISLLLQSCEFSLVSSNLKEEATKCYTCKGDCSSPGEHTCGDITSSCFSKLVVTTEGRPMQTKDCVEVNKLDSICNYETENVLSCYTCDDDLCNKNDGAARCYMGVDDDPYKRYCGKIFHDMKTVCMTVYQSTDDGEVTVTRTCMDDNDDIRTACDSTNQIDGKNCTICDTDLCNGEDDENYVDQCYSCSGSCETTTIQNCSAKSKCFATNDTSGEEYVARRGCMILTSTFEENCDLLNDKFSSCVVCDTNLCNESRKGDDGDDGSNGPSGSERVNFVVCILLITNIILHV